MNIEILIGKLLKYYQIKTLNDLAIKLDTTQSTISGWKARNAIGALTDTVANKAPEALEYIFSPETNVNNFNNSKNALAQAFGGQNTNNYNENIQSDNIEIDKNILKLVDTLYNFAKDNNKIDELKTDLSSLLPKYM
ncbi:hypothetical protein QUR76_08455 [Arcobacter cryaerophilus gv. pseudocryaerophilus]|uniref:Uncharacterized protein n=3 Tax=unclassified Arcobacter TaxID=2593671 RepID=A0AA96RAU5_9BACT|nr:hypothetical protein RMQ65_10465 [Arcobacter sp. AZ-2023]WPD05154.1 hypothetical protein QUR76_08455 [Arcobacter sp. DSM 115956]WPD07248.1 hypothetical protein QUR78_08450 [Arcobacter sp. DSM 115955]WNL31513.1 hypothetical protein RMQ67_08450 [Arcobacter sp. AZ-2023]WNP37663.1 hypothetical protein RJG58_08450 [Arcobacter sp. AZ-2023]